MRVVIQRVQRAEVIVDGKSVAQIERGFVTLLGVADGDTEAQAKQLIKKITELRVFEDEAGKMNRSLLDVGGSHLVVSQFTLLADCSSGRRPSFTGAAAPALARALYHLAMEHSRSLGVETQGGVFGADMKLSLVNDGPATFVLDSVSET